MDSVAAQDALRLGAWTERSMPSSIQLQERGSGGRAGKHSMAREYEPKGAAGPHT
jgi:hypothetical protein